MKTSWLKSLKSWGKRFWHYLWYDDSVGSYALNFVVAYLLIKFLIFPGIGFALDTGYPVVAIVSGSMEHQITDNRVCGVEIPSVENRRLDFEEYWGYCGGYYEKNYNITQSQFQDFPYSKGLNIGDVMILTGKDPTDVEVGDVLVFIPDERRFYEQRGPVIHRVVAKNYSEASGYQFQTKGDHNAQSVAGFERNISEEDILGVAVFRIPYIGYAKVLFSKGIQSVGLMFQSLG